MRFRPVVVVAAAFMVCAFLVAIPSCDAQSAPAPAYVVHAPGLRVSAMSPDEKHLSAVVVHRPRNAAFTAELQLWDFRSGSLVTAQKLEAPELQPRHPEPMMHIRYTADGQLLAVYAGGDLLRVLRASDLEAVRTIPLQAGGVSAVEVSPTGHRVAVRLAGAVKVFDLDSGEPVQSWTVHAAQVMEWPFIQLSPRLDGAGLAWREDGKAVAISIADDLPCRRGGGTIDVFEIGSAEAVETFRVPLLPGYVAFGSGKLLYVASETCGGYFAHWTLDLPVFDSTTGRQVDKIAASKVGVRSYVTLSANKQILVAYADREKTTFAGLEDTLETRDPQWQVWELATKKLVLSMPAKENMSRRAYLAVSSTGRFVYANGAEEVSIFSVPAASRPDVMY